MIKIKKKQINKSMSNDKNKQKKPNSKKDFKKYRTQTR
jgi:hypothetical protein